MGIECLSLVHIHIYIYGDIPNVPPPHYWVVSQWEIRTPPPLF